MSLKLGYLLPTRENVMQQRPAAGPLLDAAKLAQDLGFDSVWAGDSLLARPRHDPLTLLAAVAAAAPGMTVGTAVLLPALRNPVVLAQQLATIDQISAGRLIVGAGIAADMPAIHAEFTAAGVPFEGRVGRLMEGFRLCKALWRGEPVTWDGRWQMEDVVLGPEPHRPGGPPIWIGTGAAAGIERCAKHYDGWFPIGPDAETFGQRRQLFIETARQAGRDPQQLTTALYLTLCVMDDGAAADAAIDAYLEQYYGVPADIMRRVQACKGGDLDDVLAFVRSYIDAGAEHLVLRLVGDHNATLRAVAAQRHALTG